MVSSLTLALEHRTGIRAEVSVIRSERFTASASSLLAPHTALEKAFAASITLPYAALIASTN